MIHDKSEFININNFYSVKDIVKGMKTQAKAWNEVFSTLMCDGEFHLWYINKCLNSLV